jgi:hypothetical protein
MGWSVTELSLSAAGVTGGGTVTGATVNLEAIRSTHAAQVSVSAVSGGGGLTVILWGSLNSADWYEFASVYGFSAAGTVVIVSTGTQPAQYVRVTATADPSYSATVSATVTSL